MTSSSQSQVFEAWGNKKRAVDNLIKISTYLMAFTPMFNESGKDEAGVEISEEQLDYLKRIRHIHNIQRLAYQIKITDMCVVLFKSLRRSMDRLVKCCGKEKIEKQFHLGWSENKSGMTQVKEKKLDMKSV